MPLTKQDKKDISKLVKDELLDFYVDAIHPEFDKIDKRFDKLERDLTDFKQETKNNFMDVRRQISDLKIDTPARSEFAGHEKRIHRLEKHLFFV